MAVDSGEVVALLGENGAGKSTLIKILAGVYTADAGAISYRGVDMTATLRRMPIAFIHQDLGLIDWMTVAENICLTLGYPSAVRLDRMELARASAPRARSPSSAPTSIPTCASRTSRRTEKSLVAIARALATDAEILVLDEPTASLPADEVVRLFAALRRLREHGVGMIYVSHRLDEVFEIADRMVVLRDGQVAGERVVAQTTPEETILLIVGREPSQIFRRPAERQGAPRLEFDAASCRRGRADRCQHPRRRDRRIRRAARRRPGERSAARCSASTPIDRRPGRARRADGSRSLDPRAAMASRHQSRLRRPRRRIDHAGPFRAREFLPQSARGGRGLFSLLAPRREGARRRASSARRSACVRTIPALAIELLSGGNQQKVVVGRWLNLKAKIYVFEDPTAGVDVGAKAEIYRLFDVALKAAPRS